MEVIEEKSAFDVANEMLFVMEVSNGVRII